MANPKDAPKIYRNVKWGEITRAAGNNRFSGKPVNPAVVAAFFVSADARRAANIVTIGAATGSGVIAINLLNSPSTDPVSIVYKTIMAGAAAYAVTGAAKIFKKFSNRDAIRNRSTMHGEKPLTGQKELTDLVTAINKRDEFILDILKEKPALRPKHRDTFQRLTREIKSASGKGASIIKGMKQGGSSRDDLKFAQHLIKMAKEGVASFLPNLEKNNTGK